jgi:mannosyl-3-phosphoglycerate phosphatase
MPNAPTTIVFSDLDGTLLDHETYSWDAAKPALAALKENGIPLILASSKTAAEISGLRAEMGFAEYPAIIENGAGLLEPKDSADNAGDFSVHRRLIAILDSLPLRLRENFIGFCDVSVARIAKITGLDLETAAKAARRQFSEPGTWSGTDEERAEFETLLAENGITARQGGRFLTLSFGASKAQRMIEIVNRYACGDRKPFTIALGDAPNDIEMLETADTGVVVANPRGAPLPELDGESIGRIIRTAKPGPEGWNEAVLRLI